MNYVKTCGFPLHEFWGLLILISRPRCCTKNAGARREALGIADLWPSFATRHPAFFVRNPKGWGGFRPDLRYSPTHCLQREAHSTAPSCLALDEIRRHHGREISG